MLDDLKFIHHKDAQDALGTAEKQYAASDFMKTEMQVWLPTVPTKQNIAKQIALECIGKSVVMYAGPALIDAARYWKACFNERARQLAWVGELSPSELAGWTKQPQAKPYAVIELLSEHDSAEVQQLFAAATRVLSGLRPEPIRVHVAGTNSEEQLAWAQSLGDFVTIYVSLLNGVDPSSEAVTDKFKQRED